MANSTGSGLSSLEDDDKALDEALSQALEKLGDAAPKVGMVFSGPKRPLDQYLKSLRGKFPEADFMGCTTAGELTEAGMVHNGVSVFLIAGDQFMHRSAVAMTLKSDPEASAEELCEDYEDLREDAKKQGFLRSTSIVLADGLAGTGEDALDVLVEETSAFNQFVGGASGDEGAFAETSVGLNSECGPGGLAVTHVFSKTNWGIGTGHGLTPASEKLMVTNANGARVNTINNRPAFEIYKEHAAKNGVELTPENAGGYMIEHELGIYFFERVTRARAPLAVNEDGSLDLAAAIKPNSQICILDGNVDEMVAAARSAATEAKKNMGDAEVAGVVLFDCVCRGLILGDQFDKEIAAVKEVFGDVPISGFLTYGEIARCKGHLENWHNTTAVVLAIPK